MESGSYFQHHRRGRFVTRQRRCSALRLLRTGNLNRKVCSHWGLAFPREFHILGGRDEPSRYRRLLWAGVKNFILIKNRMEIYKKCIQKIQSGTLRWYKNYISGRNWIRFFFMLKFLKLKENRFSNFYRIW